MDYFLNGIKNALILIATLDSETYSAIFTSLRASSLSLLASIIIGLPLGFFLGFYNFRGKKIVKNIVNSLLSLPTVVVGLFVYMFISSRG
ncbi:MAG: ABC transporter permease, partial [Flexistipes sinusarabici]